MTDPLVTAELVIDALARSECQLRERCASLEADCDCYRAVALEAVAAVAAVTAERDRLRAQLSAARDEYRALRALLLRQAAAA